MLTISALTLGIKSERREKEQRWKQKKMEMKKEGKKKKIMKGNERRNKVRTTKRWGEREWEREKLRTGENGLPTPLAWICSRWLSCECQVQTPAVWKKKVFRVLCSAGSSNRIKLGNTKWND